MLKLNMDSEWFSLTFHVLMSRWLVLLGQKRIKTQQIGVTGNSRQPGKMDFPFHELKTLDMFQMSKERKKPGVAFDHPRLPTSNKQSWYM
jgi:hypothetical protein